MLYRFLEFPAQDGIVPVADAAPRLRDGQQVASARQK
jgi:hypothetical protein